MGFFVSYNDRKDRGFLKSLNAPPVKSCGRSLIRGCLFFFGLKAVISQAAVSLIANQRISVQVRVTAEFKDTALV